ncbi:Transcriptional regulatory protein RXT2 N-terminal domain-containing protein [Madurella fahalii]|uniref:Transcriptional regulatory protein RXT2 N-terminal domain-containing protein n=1 Tax=Madurella fahalii TaxID=1157608 RepID=A0ABQ0GDL8_9PEZI
MSTQQQAMIMETILSIRRTLKRKDYDSDSDSSIDHSTNRGNKLKKRARFVKQGRLASSMGPAAYKEVAEHAGYQRAIINQNPRLVDEEGYDIDSDDDEEHIQEALNAAMEDNPYSSVRLEQILAPLTAVTDLPSHPTLSRPFTSKALTELIEQGRNLMHKENAALWKAKPLLTKLVGDNTWAPCGLMTAPDDRDALLFSDTTSFFNRPTPHAAGDSTSTPSLNGGRTVPENALADLVKRGAGLDAPQLQAAVSQPVGTEQRKEPQKRAADGQTPPEAQAVKSSEMEPGESNAAGKPDNDAQVNGEPRQNEENKDSLTQADVGPDRQPNTTGGEDVEMTEAAGIGPSISTTADQQHTSPRTTAPMLDLNSRAGSDTAAEPSPEEHFIHPLFHLPRAAHPERDLGLPEQEAEEVRRLLLLYVQKQEEICRGTKRLFEGLLRADRYRKTVWQWAKAEAHRGEMSDGEDWYDKEEWGLTEDLKKGEDEVEEDTAQTQKKTRNRK